MIRIKMIHPSKQISNTWQKRPIWHTFPSKHSQFAFLSVSSTAENCVPPHIPRLKHINNILYIKLTTNNSTTIILFLFQFICKRIAFHQNAFLRGFLLYNCRGFHFWRKNWFFCSDSFLKGFLNKKRVERVLGWWKNWWVDGWINGLMGGRK